MKILKAIVILVFAATQLHANTIVDMAGREVKIPTTIEHIVPYDTKASLMLYSVAADRMDTRALLPGVEKFTYINSGYEQLPEVDIKNIEQLLMINPQVIIAGAYIGSDNLERFDKMEKRTHIPVVVIDLSIDKMSDTYLFLGEMLAIESQCRVRAEYIESIYTLTQDLIESNPEVKERIYYSIGGNGLMSDPAGSRHTEVIDYLRLNNVVNVPIPSGGHASVNMEQVLEWNPNIIFCAGFRGNGSAYKTITSSNKWKSIDAVKSKKIYNIPSMPFGWFDNPPSINRIPGIIWLCELFYGLDSTTSREMITEFYKLFYHYELTASEYDTLFM
ncbi:MAG: ABC transporter substrate-binding protein [Rikenellaceae bacterium]